MQFSTEFKLFAYFLITNENHIRLGIFVVEMFESFVFEGMGSNNYGTVIFC